MSRFFLTASFIVSLLVVGCATTGGGTKSKTPEEEGMICKTEMPTGTRIPQKTCTRAEAAEDRSVSDQIEWERKLRSVPADIDNK